MVKKDSARFGLPGEKENIVAVHADHGGICKFGISQKDQDELKIVQGNIRDLFENALRKCEYEFLRPTSCERNKTEEDLLMDRFRRLRNN